MEILTPWAPFRTSLVTLRVALVCLVGMASGRAFYFDSDSGRDANAGTSRSQALRSLAITRSTKFKAGDSLLFKRGGYWTKDSLFLSSQGTAIAPIVVSAYGNPSLRRPHLHNTGYLVVLNKASHIVIEDLELSGARGGCLEMWDSTVSHVVVRRIEAHDCGGGVYATGTDISILDNQIHDGHMVVNTKNTMDDDYGATGVGLSKLDGCLVRGNRMWNLVAPSYDYGVDGGAIEFWKTVRHCDIYGNFALNADGFSEFGGQPGDSVIAVSVHHNVSLETGPLACFHMSDPTLPFGITYDSVRFDNNLSVDRFANSWGFHIIADGGKLDRPNRIQIRNNIFVTDSANSYHYQQNDSKAPTWIHVSNLLWNRFNDPFAAGSGRVRGSGELFGHPRFHGLLWDSTAVIDTVLSDYRLLPESPAYGTGLDLGYANDYFGHPASVSGIVDRGPFARGTFTGLVPERKARSRQTDLRLRAGQVEIQLHDLPTGTQVELVAREVSGKTVRKLGMWKADAGFFERKVDLPRKAGLLVLDLSMNGNRRSVEMVPSWKVGW
ncbi:MAG: right-handed parallel beta-helix repeat-containing protein [Fibrobacterota bacterium]|nr:right-handed parallel beta-helix repeat-containing protein [Fibrobacterota bacterium]QQS07554.1 MAG: right-handed parallel beta-helix repeat-containing protein [Fibrobacterota bacterium]